jgi:DNA-binding transcriptional ArsR family regulator
VDAHRSPYEDLSSLNRLVHEPARLAILTALSACDEADFLFLLNITGLTKGNLSSHLSKLEQGGLVVIRKAFEGRVPVTYARLSLEGQAALKEYWERLDRFKKRVRPLKPIKAN